MTVVKTVVNWSVCDSPDRLARRAITFSGTMFRTGSAGATGGGVGASVLETKRKRRWSTTVRFTAAKFRAPFPSIQGCRVMGKDRGND